MHKGLIVALCLASLAVLAGMQAASANAICVTTCLGWELLPVVDHGKTTLIPHCRHPQRDCTGQTQGPGPVQPIQQSKLRRQN